jgi:hypothetical protein
MRVFEDMKGIYLEKHENFSRKFNESLPDRTFLRSLVRTLKENGSSEFSKLLESTHLKIDDVDQDEELKNLESSVDHPSLDKSSISLVHGDLHQGNVLFQRDVYETDGEEQVIGVTSKGIIDWDSAGFDIPYQDFFHLSVISDLERDSTLYNEARDSFLEMQSESFPGVTEEKMKFTEFITYLSLLNRYYKAIKDKEIRPEFRKNVLKSCTYLFERSKETVRELSELTNDTELEQSYDAFSSDKFKKLDNVDSDPDASVAYAHTVNQKFRKTNKNEMALVNRKRHQENIEHLVGGEARSRSVLPIDIATLWGVYVVGVGFGLNEIPHDDPSYPQFIEEAKTYGKMLLGLSGVGTLMYYKENVRNFIREKKSKLFKKS